MSTSKRRSAGFNPPSEPTRFSVDELSQLKKVLSDSGLSKWIIAAGVGAILEGLHIIWLAARYIFKF